MADVIIAGKKNGSVEASWRILTFDLTFDMKFLEKLCEVDR